MAGLAIRLARHGCTNRPFYHIVVMRRRLARNGKIIEQIGTFDPMPNTNNEKLVAVNFERLQFWMSRNILPTKPVLELLGLSGFLPIHPSTYINSKRNRALAATSDTQPTVASKETAENLTAQP